jgi:hypothetical protein
MNERHTPFSKQQQQQYTRMERDKVTSILGKPP